MNYSTQIPPTVRRCLLKDSSYKKRRRITPDKMSSFLIKLHNYVLCANQSLSLCYPYSILQHARRAVGGDWVLYVLSVNAIISDAVRDGTVRKLALSQRLLANTLRSEICRRTRNRREPDQERGQKPNPANEHKTSIGTPERRLASLLLTRQLPFVTTGL